MSHFENIAKNIYEEILFSKKYSTLYKPLVLRVCEEEYKKYSNDKERVKGAKSTLHAMYGAYLTVGCHKKANKILKKIKEENENHEKKNEERENQKNKKQENLKGILQLHASTKERTLHLTEFYQFIFENIGSIKSVLDIGCGLNPFTLPYMPNNDKIVEYHALDIDYRIADLNNSYFTSLGLPALAGCADIITETPRISVEVAFLFKLLPLIERQAKGRGIQLLREIDARHLIITYPTKSLSGKMKGMKAFYAAVFEEMFRDELSNDLFISAKGEIGDELIYVVNKK